METIHHAAAWQPGDLSAAASRWQYTLTRADVAELTAALRQVQAKNQIVPQFGKEDFPIPQLMAKLSPYEQELAHGLGVLYIKGLPVESLSIDEVSVIFWGLGLHFGRPWEQNKRGHLLGDVINEGKAIGDTSARGYQTTATLDMHTDGADVVGLLCVKQAPEGGESQIVSAVAVHNHLARTQPEVLAHLLATEWCIDWRDEEPPNDKPYHRAKIFETGPTGLITCFSLVPYIFSAQRHREKYSEIPQLTAFDEHVLKVFSAATEDQELVFKYRLEAGDMTFLNNHFHLHGRSHFKDAEDPKQRRHLRRLWLEFDSWEDIRPKAMQSILINAHAHWATKEPTVQMWDIQQ